MASQINGVSIAYSTVCSGAGQIKPQSSATGEFSAQRASNAENVSIWSHQHDEPRAPFNIKSIWFLVYDLSYTDMLLDRITL